MKVPAVIIQKVETILARDAEEKKQERIAKLAEKQRWQEVEKLRKKKKKELLAYAQKVVDWLKDFYDSKDGKKILRIKGYATVFNASFWNGFPAPGREMTTFATIEISANGPVSYGERYKGFPRQGLQLGTVKEVTIEDRIIRMSPGGLVRKLHPEYLELFSKSIDSGKVWQYIEWSLR